MLCITCDKPITDEQDYTTLVCHAAGQTICHTTQSHDKCWEKFKKTFVRGRGTSSRTQTFFCPVSGCHNALEHQHMSIRKKSSAAGTRSRCGESASFEPKYAALPGLDGAPRLPVKQGAERRGKREPLEKIEDEDDEETRCSASKTDGTRCGRPIFDPEYRVCKLHAESARRAAEFAKKVADDLESQKQQATESSVEEHEDLPPISSVVPGRSRGINIEIPDRPAKPAESEAGSTPSRDSEPQHTGDKGQMQAPPLRPAPWAAALDGINQKKGWGGSCDQLLLESCPDCPVCLDSKADVQMKPCDHALCGTCLDQWMSQRSSFAQTLRNGSSVTTCPLCRAAVHDTAPVSLPRPAPLANGESSTMSSPRSYEQGTPSTLGVEEDAAAAGQTACTSGSASSPTAGGRKEAPNDCSPADSPREPSSRYGTRADHIAGVQLQPWDDPAGRWCGQLARLADGGVSWGAASPYAVAANERPNGLAWGSSEGMDATSGGSNGLLAAMHLKSGDVAGQPPGMERAVGWSHGQRGAEASAHAEVPAAASSLAELNEDKTEPRASNASQDSEALDATMEARLAAVVLDEPDSELFGNADQAPFPSILRSNSQTCTPSSWPEAQVSASNGASSPGRANTPDESKFTPSPQSPQLSQDTRSEETNRDAARAARDERSRANQKRPLDPPPSLVFPGSSRDVWAASSSDGLGNGLWGTGGLRLQDESKFSTFQREAREAEEQLRNELETAHELLRKTQEVAARELRRADRAEALSEGLQALVSSLQDELQTTRNAERAKSAQFDRLQDEHLSLLRAEEEAKKSVSHMIDQLEQKDHEIQMLQQDLQHAQHVESMAANGVSHGHDPRMAYNPALMPNGQYSSAAHFYPMQPAAAAPVQPHFPPLSNHVRHHHMQQGPQPIPVRHPPHSAPQPPQSLAQQIKTLHKAAPSVPPLPAQQAPPQALRQASGPPAEGASGPAAAPAPSAVAHPAAAQPKAPMGTSSPMPTPPGGGWKCSHCTFVNTSSPILDGQTKQYKGFCEICEGVTTLHLA